MDFNGVDLAITHFVTQFTYVSRHFRAWNRKEEKQIRDNCFENGVSEILKNDLFYPYNLPQIRNAFVFVSF